VTRRAFALPLILTLVVPATAAAQSKRVKLPLPAEGDISFARYTVKNASGVTIRRSPRLGDSMVLTGGRSLGRRRHEVFVVLANPGTGAGAAQEGEGLADLIFKAIEEDQRATARKTSEATDLMTKKATPAEARAVNQACGRRSRRTIGRRFRRSRSFFRSRGGTAGALRRMRVLFAPQVCQDAPASTTAPASRQLRELGIAVPGCSGTVERYQGSPNEVSARMVCTQATNVFSLRAATGNDGLNCLGPPDSTCACGPFCAPLPRESACYFDNDGFQSDTLLEFRAAFAQPVMPQDVSGIWVPQGSPVVDARHAYLRHIFDTP
jgi:hypothetical protein